MGLYIITKVFLFLDENKLLMTKIRKFENYNEKLICNLYDI